MAAIDAANLVALAKLRYGAAVLEGRVAPTGDTAAKDLELLKKAFSVYTRVIAACQQAAGWPIPGTWPAGSKDPRDGTSDISGQAYADVWPADLLEHAIGLLNWRTYDGFAGVSMDVRKIGEAHEQYFKDIENGTTALGVGQSTDVLQPVTLTVRDRFGNNLLNDGASDQVNVLDSFVGPGWDDFR